MMKLFMPLLLISIYMLSCTQSGEQQHAEELIEKIPLEASLEERTKEEVLQETIEANLYPIDNKTARIATALMAAPKSKRENATVLGHDDNGQFVTLKHGTNELICLADNPKKQGFSAACYHKDLEPFMARGRALRALNKTREEIFKIREKEVKSGELKMAGAGATLQIYYSDEVQYNPENAEVAGAKYRYVVYLPFATSSSIGLSEQPNTPSDPWLMDAGTHKAHIMINPSVQH